MKKSPIKPADLEDDALLDAVQDLIDEIGAKPSVRETVNEAEETLDENGEFEEEERKGLEDILVVLRDRQEKGDVVEEVDLDDFDDDLDDEIEGDEIEDD